MLLKNKIYRLLEKVDSRHHMKWYIKQKISQGMIVGRDTHIFSKIGGGEPYLISIGSGTTISTNVTILTHDASIGAIIGRDYVSDLIGRVTIGDHVFVGSGTTIMYGVSIGDRSIVAAGSVVTKSIPSGFVVGGNPAHIICSTDYFVNKSLHVAFSLHGKKWEMKKSEILSRPDNYINRTEMK